MNKSSFIFLLFGFLFFFSGFSQAKKNHSIQELDSLSNEALDNLDYSAAIDYAVNLIDLASKDQNLDYLYRGYNKLGITYEILEDFDRAKDSYSKALEYAIEINNDTILLGAYNNLGNSYSEVEETVQEGLAYYDKAIEIGNKFEDSLLIFNPVLNKAWTYLDNEQYEEAFPYLERTHSLVGAEPRRSLQANILALYGKYYTGTGDLDQAKELFEASLEISEEDSLEYESSFAYLEYSKMLFKSGDFKESYKALAKHEEAQDRIFEEEKIHQMESAYAQFKTEESKKQLELSQREQEFKDEVIAKSQQVSIVLVVSVMIMLLFLILLFRNNRVRRKLIGQLKGKNNELVEAKEEAEKLSLLKTRFFSTVSHELRTPLYGVVGLTSLLLEDNKDNGQVEDLKSLKFSADYLLALINDVLQMNKMESKLVHLEDVPFNLRTLLRGIVKSFEFTRKHNNNEITLEIADEIPADLIGDSVRLSQVIMNLAGNAIKFTERGRIWIQADLVRRENNTCLIHFEVGDTGIGIPGNKQQEIFEEFSQLSSNNFSYQGTGLGLSIVKKLLSLFGSKIHMRSKEGEGSVFNFEILFGEGNHPDEHAAVLDIFSENLERKALIVDDNRINQVVTRRILEKRDFKCEVAGDGSEAIARLMKENFDLVLMDINMPGISGMETTVKIRKFNKEVPIIALTAVEIDEMREEILGSGMNDIIIKPYDTQQFFNTIFKNLLAPATEP